MNSKWQRLAPFGLYLAGLALLISAGAYILQQQFSVVVRVGLIVAALGLALNIFLDPASARIALTGRQARYGSNALLLSLAFLGVVVVANFLVFKNDQRWDLTENQDNSLAPETLDILANLDQTIIAKAFYTQRNPSITAGEDLLKLFKQESAGKLQYEIIDPEADPIAAQQANVSRDGDIILFLGDRQEKASFASEQGLAEALVKLISTGDQTVYFITGHGEYDPNSSGDRSYSSVKGILESKNYVVNNLNLLTVSEIPSDANAVVIAGYQKVYSENEVALLQKYAEAGGNLLVLVDPSIFTEVGDSPDSLLAFIEQDFGILVKNDLIIDLVGQSQLGQPLLAVGASYGNHPITQGLENFATVFPEARSLDVVEVPSGITPEKIVLTQEQSWAETDFPSLQAGNQPEPNEGADTFGPVAIMMAAENFELNSRIMVGGDSDFAANGNVNAFGNMDLFVNTLDWVVGQEELIQLTPKPTTERTLNLPSIQYMTGLIILVTIFVLPGSVLAAGIGVAISHRRRS